MLGGAVAASLTESYIESMEGPAARAGSWVARALEAAQSHMQEADPNVTKVTPESELRLLSHGAVAVGELDERPSVPACSGP